MRGAIFEYLARYRFKKVVQKTEGLMRAMGRYIASLGGEYQTGEDVGTTLDDMELLCSETDHVVTLPEYCGGAGDIGPALEGLLKEGGEVVVTDLDRAKTERAARELGVKVIAPDDIYRHPCDIYAPYALAEERHGTLLHERGIVYAPDYVASAGGTDLRYGPAPERWSQP